MKLITRFFISTVVILLASPSFAHHLVVATTGSDISGTGTEASPWQTFDHALNDIQPGDTLFIRGGKYQQQLNILSDGNATAGNIVIESWPGEFAELRDTDYSTTGITVGASYITLANLTVDHWSNAIEIAPPAHHIELLHCTVFDIGFGIAVYDGVHDVNLQDCEMHNFGWFGFDATAAGTSNLIYNISLFNCYSHDADYTIPIHNGDMNADGFAFGHNNERDITLTNCHAARTGDGFDLDGHNIRVINCTANNTHYGAGGGFKCWGDSVMLINCLSYGHLNSGIELDQETEIAEQFHNKPTNTFIINCTDADNGQAGIQVYDSLKKLFMYNTIIAGGDRKTGADTGSMKGLEFDMIGATGGPVNYTGDYNIFHSINAWRYVSCPEGDFGIDASQSLPLSGWQILSHQDAHSQFVWPQLLPDYRLDAASPALDAGTPLHTWPTDIDGAGRDSKPDIGCYEGALTGIQSKTISSTPIQFLYPNPTRDVVSVAVDETHSGVVRILDLTGKILREHLFERQKTVEVALGGLAAGMYLCEVLSGVNCSMTMIDKK